MIKAMERERDKGQRLKRLEKERDDAFKEHVRDIEDFERLEKQKEGAERLEQEENGRTKVWEEKERRWEEKRAKERKTNLEDEDVGVDKIIRINLSTEGPVSPYIHERLS